MTRPGFQGPAGSLLLAAVAGCAPPPMRGANFLHDEHAMGPYSGSVIAETSCYLSGKIGDASGTFEHEVATAIDAVDRELAKGGLTLAHLVQVTVFLTDIDLYASFNEVYASRLAAPYPARTLVAVTALPGGARVEIQAIARRQ